MNIFAKFDEMLLQDIKEKKPYGHTFIRSDGQTDGWTDNVKTVYPPTNTVCGGYKNRTGCLEMWLIKSRVFLLDHLHL